MTLEEIAKVRQDPRYLLLRFALKVLTKDGKLGTRNKEYIAFCDSYKHFFNRNKILLHRVIKNLYILEYNRPCYIFIYNEMVTKYGYTGVNPGDVMKERIYKNKKKVENKPLYLTDDFISDNKNIID